MLRSLLLGLAIFICPSLSHAGDWVMIDPPMFLHQNCDTCVNTYSKGGYRWYFLDVPCVLRKGAYGGYYIIQQSGQLVQRGVQYGTHTVINSGDLILHNTLPPYCHCGCGHWSHSDYKLHQRPHWTRYSIFSTRRLVR